MAGISYFVALPFDATDNGIVAGESVECPSPAAAVALLKVFGKYWVMQVRSRSVALVIRRPAILVMQSCCGSSATCRMI